MLKKERFTAKYSTAVGQIPRSLGRISSFPMRYDTIRGSLTWTEKQSVVSLIQHS